MIAPGVSPRPQVNSFHVDVAAIGFAGFSTQVNGDGVLGKKK